MQQILFISIILFGFFCANFCRLAELEGGYPESGGSTSIRIEEDGDPDVSGWRL